MLRVNHSAFAIGVQVLVKQYGFVIRMEHEHHFTHEMEKRSLGFNAKCKCGLVQFIYNKETLKLFHSKAK